VIKFKLMKTQDAINLAGSPTRLARILGITPSAISQWGETLPKARIWQLQLVRPEWFDTDKKRKPVAESV
jgi:transcriptional repressor of cell division inhibition gene dicB